MATNCKTSLFFKNHLIFWIYIYIFTSGVDASGFIMAKSCGKEIRLEHMTFSPGSVWMQIVEATFLFLGHDGLLSTTSGSILQSGDPQGEQCNLTPFKTMQVITTPDNEVHLRDPTTRQFICRVKNVALSLQEATGYISCENKLNNAEMEMRNLIQRTDHTSSVLLNEEPKPATTMSATMKRISSASTSTFPVREKRKLHQISTDEILLPSTSFVHREFSVSSTAVLGLSSEVFNTAESNESSLYPIETPQPRIIIQESSQNLFSSTGLIYDRKEIESRPTPKPALYNWHLPETSTTVINSITVPLSIRLQPTATFRENVSLIDFSSSEDHLASTSDMTSEVTMIFGGVQDSSLRNIDMDPDSTFDSLIGSFDDSSVPTTTMLDNVNETEVIEDEYDDEYYEYDETEENTVYKDPLELHISSSDYPQHSIEQSSMTRPTSVYEPSIAFVSVRKGPSSHPKNASINKSSQGQVKMVSTNEEIKNRILNYFPQIEYILNLFKDSTSKEHDVKPSGINLDRNASVSINSSNVISNILDFWPGLNNDTYPEVDQVDRFELSHHSGNGMPNDILNYVSKKTNISPTESEEISVSSSISPASERNHSDSDIAPSNSPVNLSYVRRLSETRGDTRDEANFALPVTTGNSLHSDVNMVSISEDVLSQQATKSQRSTWMLLIGGGIVLQVQLIIGLIMIWCCLRRKFKKYGETEEPANIYDGFSKVVNFRNSGKISDDPEKCSAHVDENESGSTSEAKLPKCLTTSL